MRRIRPICFALYSLLLPCSVALAEPLRYSGALIESGQPAAGTYALRMALYDAAEGGHRIGKELTLFDVEVSDGAFATEVDFGLPLITLQRAWLQVEVAGSDGHFERLGAREALDTKQMQAAACWDTAGNSGTVAGTNFLGTLDNQRLDVRVNGVRAMSIIPTAATANLVAGLPANSVRSPAVGATIAGGGKEGGFSNTIDDDYGFIGGGISNRVGTFAGGSATDEPYGTIGGGHQNSVRAELGTIGGGLGNSVHGEGGTVPGGNFNLAGGRHSFAAGSLARVRAEGVVGNTPGTGTADGDAGTFVWADDAGGFFVSSGPNQFLLRAQGGVGINTTPASADVELTIEGRSNDSFQGNVDLVLIPSANGASDEGIAIAAGLGGAGTNDAIFTIAQRNSTQFVSRFRIDTDGTTRNTSGAWSTLSDARVKRNIESIPSPLATLLGLRGHRFEYTEAAPGMNDGKRLGFVAQEVREVLPQWVRLGSDGYYSVTPAGFEALAVEAMRELAEENVALHADSAALKRANAELREAQEAQARRLARIEARLDARAH